MSFSSYDALEARDLSFLRQVLEEACAERGVILDSAEAAGMARSLIDWYLFGIRHPQQLKDMLDPLPLRAGS
ncbi:hypothetical protein [Rhizobium sp. CSW-27]|uniref:hypothetical protein n=1 Tax=Rhizobium sp. CSW-27 TaxID=2839985 RepID=UPI001C012CD7|nr:hypothetical protein [Rhizobium sp. CSW-27]MBT9372713.1 hypothetical protein [Rhizobium sp. CSW-27]